MGEVGTLCSGLPGCCCGWDKGAVGERVVGNPPCAGSTGGNVVCMCGPSGDWCACPTHLLTAPHMVPPTALPHSSPETGPPPTHSYPHMHTRGNVKPDEEEHTNSNVATHNIAIGGTLG